MYKCLNCGCALIWHRIICFFPLPGVQSFHSFFFDWHMASCRCSKQHIHVDPDRRTVSIRAIHNFKPKRFFTCKAYETNITQKVGYRRSLGWMVNEANLGSYLNGYNKTPLHTEFPEMRMKAKASTRKESVKKLLGPDWRSPARIAKRPYCPSSSDRIDPVRVVLVPSIINVE